MAINTKQKKGDFWFEDTALWRFKVRLQFTGWLQYVIGFLLASVALLLSGLFWLIGFGAGFFLIVAIILYLISLFDLVTVKFGLRPKEPLPKPRADLDEFDLMRARRACRSFQNRMLTEDHLDAVMDLVSRFTTADQMLGDKSMRLEYIPARLTVWPVLGAREFLVAIAPKKYDRMSVIDVGRNLQKVVHEMTRMGLATCWIGPGADQNSVIKELGDKFDAQQDHVICVCAIGYKSMFKPLMLRLADQVQHKRKPLEELFFADADCTVSIDTKIVPYSDYGRCYEVCQWGPSSYNSQTTRAWVQTQNRAGHEKLAQVNFGASTGSRYYAAVAVGIWCTNWEIGCQALGKKGELTLPDGQQSAQLQKRKSTPCDVCWMASTAPQ